MEKLKTEYVCTHLIKFVVFCYAFLYLSSCIGLTQNKINFYYIFKKKSQVKRVCDGQMQGTKNNNSLQVIHIVRFYEMENDIFK